MLLYKGHIARDLSVDTHGMAPQWTGNPKVAETRCARPILPVIFVPFPLQINLDPYDKLIGNY